MPALPFQTSRTDFPDALRILARWNWDSRCLPWVPVNPFANKERGIAVRAWIIDSFAGIDSMRQANVEDVEPSAGEVTLRVEYAGLNPADAYLAEGQYPAKPPLPHILGRDCSGEIVHVGAGVEGFQPGQRKAILRGDTGVSRWGTFAERVTVPAESLVDIPAGWSPEQGSCAALVYLTAYQALTQWEDLPEKAVVLIGAGSGTTSSPRPDSCLLCSWVWCQRRRHSPASPIRPS
jgi:D-arabinose 1-dehydrogenase-like Zn-dependent alcohol dehydrogenase